MDDEPKTRKAGRRESDRVLDSLEQEFLDKAYLAILPAAMTAHGWQIDGRPIERTDDRLELARKWALAALRHRPRVGER